MGGNDKPPEIQIRDLEIQILLLYIHTVIDENECLCDMPPFVDGNQCSVCEGHHMLAQFRVPINCLPKNKVLVNLDNLRRLLNYLAIIDGTPFSEMFFLKDGRSVELEIETLERFKAMGRSNVSILAWGGEVEDKTE